MTTPSDAGRAGERALDDAWGAFGRTCEHCGQRYGGSHYHCACGSLDVTSMYGHHTSFCKRTGKTVAMHHCGPDDCELTPTDPEATL